MIFIENKYTSLYFNIITAALSRPAVNGYTENHHIIPDCFYVNRRRKGSPGTVEGNPSDISNKVKLTAREHFLCHKLLTKMVASSFKAKMVWAFAALAMENKNQQRHQITSHDYAHMRKLRSQLPAWNKGIPRTDKERANMSAGHLKGHAKKDPTYNIRPACRPEKAAKIKESNTGKKWVHNPENPVERRQLNADECDAYLLQGWKPGTGPRKPVAKVECPVCHKLVYPTNLGQWHGDKCGTRMNAEQRLLRSTSGKLARLPKV